MAPEYGRMNFLDEVTVRDAWSKRIWVHMSGTKPFLDCGQQLGEGWAPPGFFALDTQDEKDNHRLHHTGSVVARVSKDRACHRTSGWSKMGYWWKQQTTHTIQYQHWNMERENTETTRKVGRTYSRDEKISLECPWILWGTIEELWWNNYSGWT